MVLARGVVHVEVLPQDWEVDGEGMAFAIRLLPKVLRRMLGESARLPRTLCTDRGTGMYSPAGHVVHEYAAAVEEAGFHLLWGPCAKRQAWDIERVGGTSIVGANIHSRATVSSSLQGVGTRIKQIHELLLLSLQLPFTR